MPLEGHLLCGGRGCEGRVRVGVRRAGGGAGGARRGGGPVQLGDGGDADLSNSAKGDAIVAAVLRLRGVLAVAEVAFHLDVGALGERGRVLGQAAPDDATVPFGLAVAFAGLAVLPATPGGEGQDHERGLLGAGAARFGVLAEESD